jgi:hypothetical protein
LAEELYETPREQFSQGDILEVVPHLHFQAPLTALLADGEGGYRGSAEPVPVSNDRQGQPVLSTCKRAMGLILTHDCEIDKDSIKSWIICPIVPISELPSAQRGDAKRNRIYSLLYLPSYRNVLPESIAVLNHLTTINKDLLRQEARLASLSDIGRRSLYMQFTRWISRWELRSIECPGCGLGLNLTQALPVRTE